MQREFMRDYSLVIYKLHHSVADGVAIVSMTGACTDAGYQRSDYPRLTPRLTFLQRIAQTALMYVTMPYAIYLAQKSVMMKGNYSEIKPRDTQHTGKRKAIISKALDLARV
jgi:hypothetical protein